MCLVLMMFVSAEIKIKILSILWRQDSWNPGRFINGRKRSNTPMPKYRQKKNCDVMRWGGGRKRWIQKFWVERSSFFSLFSSCFLFLLLFPHIAIIAGNRAKYSPVLTHTPGYFELFFLLGTTDNTSTTYYNPVYTQESLNQQTNLHHQQSHAHYFKKSL